MGTIQRSGDQIGGDTETGDCVKNGKWKFSELHAINTCMLHSCSLP